MSTTSMNIRMDSETKRQAEMIFAEFGLNMTAAINMFLKQSIRERGIPFDLRLEMPNPETIAAMEETEEMSNNPDVKAYTDIDLMFKEILEDV